MTTARGNQREGDEGLPNVIPAIRPTPVFQHKGGLFEFWSAGCVRNLMTTLPAGMGRDVRLGGQGGVTETPTFLMNGSPYTDENTLERLVVSVSKRRPHERISENGPTGH
jgi:hypothetical protein